MPGPSPGLLRNPTSPRAVRGEVKSAATDFTSPRTARGEVEILVKREFRVRGEAVQSTHCLLYRVEMPKADPARDLVRLADPPQRRGGAAAFQALLVFPQRFRKIGLDEAGRDTIDPHALRAPFAGEAAA